MKQTILIAITFLIFCVGNSFANDGSFYASGNTLIPLQETQVQLKKELLKFYISDFKYMNVEIDFEFFNPGAAKTLTVGFVSPPADGDVDEELAKNPNIADFTVSVNGENAAFKVQRMSETSFKMNDEKVNGYDFVYFFPVKFKKGVNKIRHTYRFLGGNSVETQRDFSYQITTGKRWANKQIDDFELQIHLDNGIFYIPASFSKNRKPANWEIVGDGVISPKSFMFFTEENPKIKMAHLNRGYLSLKEKNFKPDNDVFLGEYHWAIWHRNLCKTGNDCIKQKGDTNLAAFFTLIPWDIEESYFTDFTAEELKYIRNYYYALRGYDFKDENLKKFYSKFFWYKPDTNLKAEDIKLTEVQEKFIETIKKVEAEKKSFGSKK